MVVHKTFSQNTRRFHYKHWERLHCIHMNHETYMKRLLCFISQNIWAKLSLTFEKDKHELSHISNLAKQSLLNARMCVYFKVCVLFANNSKCIVHTSVIKAIRIYALFTCDVTDFYFGIFALSFSLSKKVNQKCIKNVFTFTMIIRFLFWRYFLNTKNENPFKPKQISL